MVIKRLIQIVIAVVVISVGVMDSMAIEETKYKLVEKDNRFEIRDYAPHILAETIVQGNLEEAKKKAFKILFRFIFGDNRSRTKVAMTAHVGQRRIQDKWVVSFMMPVSDTLKTLPEPETHMLHCVRFRLNKWLQ